jgi:ABC-type nitrate/sulfonate/bicarbonate transport system substrate-binding protein
MFHETLTGDWQGPFIPAHVNGEADLAVDPAGTVHLLWTSPPGGDAEAPASVSYSHMEVQP